MRAKVNLSAFALFVLCVLAWRCDAVSQVGHHENHDWYKDLAQPDSGLSCCNGNTEHGDCRIVQARQRFDGQWEAYYRGTLNPQVGFPRYFDWFVIPPEKILRDDQNKVPLHAHICEREGFVYCFLRGGSGS
jgi:hypothetical protein